MLHIGFVCLYNLCFCDMCFWIVTVLVGQVAFIFQSSVRPKSLTCFLFYWIFKAFKLCIPQKQGNLEILLRLLLFFSYINVVFVLYYCYIYFFGTIAIANLNVLFYYLKMHLESKCLISLAEFCSFFFLFYVKVNFSS